MFVNFFRGAVDFADALLYFPVCLLFPEPRFLYSPKLGARITCVACIASDGFGLQLSQWDACQLRSKVFPGAVGFAGASLDLLSFLSPEVRSFVRDAPLHSLLALLVFEEVVRVR